MLEGLIKLVREHDMFDSTFPRSAIGIGIAFSVLTLTLFVEGYIAEWSFYVSRPDEFSDFFFSNRPKFF